LSCDVAPLTKAQLSQTQIDFLVDFARQHAVVRGKPHLKARHFVDQLQKQFPNVKVSPATIGRVLKANGFTYGKLRSAHLSDGHDRADVQRYRDEEFVPRLLELRRDPRFVLVWFDESWINRDVSESRGWSYASESVADKPTGKGQRVCLTAFVSADA
jgi:hypothetical protein